MLKLKTADPTLPVAGAAGKALPSFVLILLVIEFLDELVFGTREAAWPLIRDDLQLSYTQVGILLSMPGVVGNLIEPPIAILSDIWKRRVLILAGGMFFATALLLTATSWSFPVLLAAFILMNPASGMFVGLSQAALMDAEPARQEQNMARWEFSGALGNLIGPLMLAAALLLSLGWRSLHATFFLLTLLLIAAAWRFPLTKTAVMHAERTLESPGLMDGVRVALRALKRREVWRWILLLEFADLTMDGLKGYLALYLVDIGGMNEAQAGLGVFVWTCAGLPGYVLLIRLLGRVRGTLYLRYSALVVGALFIVFLLVPGVLMKLLVIGLLGFANAGWYSILKAQLYKTMPGQSGGVLAVANIAGLLGSLTPLGLGIIAGRFGLSAAMWLMLLGPVALVCALPRGKS